jgi:ParB-like chromosome segregation protein Spo0J
VSNVPVNLSQLIFDDDDDRPPRNERIVKSLIKRFRRGEAFKMPVLVKWPDGRFSIAKGWYRLEAARRCGLDTVRAYVIDGADVTLEKLQELRKSLRRSSEQEEDL